MIFPSKLLEQPMASTNIIYLCFIFQKESFSSSLIHPKISSRLEKYAKLHKYTAPILFYKKFLKPPCTTLLLRVVSKKNLVFFCFVWISFFSQQMSQRSPWLVDPNGPLDKLSWWFRPCQTMFWKISWNYDFTREILYISFQACRVFISIINGRIRWKYYYYLFTILLFEIII